MIKAVVFDLDGTILNTLEDLKNSVNYAITKYGYKEITLAQAKSYIGNGIRNLIERSIYPNTLYLEEAFLEFQQHYYRNCNNYTKPYDGIYDVIDYLKGNNIKLGVVSNKKYDMLNLLVKAHFNDSFIHIIGDGEGIKRKPEPDGLLEIARRLNINANEMCYIGDSDVDVKTCHKCECMGIFVDYGFRDKDVLLSAGAEIIASSPKELLEELKKVL